MAYLNIFLGGTFDGLHKGHEAILERAFSEGERVTIGLTSDAFVRRFKPNHQSIAPFCIRKHQLTAWLSSQGLISQATIIPIDDPHEPAASGGYDAIMVTSHNKKTGQKINELRGLRDLPPLALIEVPIVPALDNLPISSTRVRNNEIDRQGRIIMPESLRPVLSQPIGTLLVGNEIAQSLTTHKKAIIIAVGDVATKTLLDAGVKPSLAIIDFRVRRKPSTILEPYRKTLFPTAPARLPDGQDFDGELSRTASRRYSTTVKSGPGYISREAARAIEKWARGRRGKNGSVIVVSGEEDLLVLPAIQYAPIGSILYYGQPGEGLVMVVVTKAMKEKVIEILKQFT